MKTLKIIATFTVLAAAVVGAAFAQENRGLRRGENFGRFPQSAARTGAPENQSERINLAPDAPDSFGKLDPTFGTGGKVTTVLPDNDEPRTIKMQPDGNILVTGYALDSNGYIIKTYVVRYNQNGRSTPDSPAAACIELIIRMSAFTTRRQRPTAKFCSPPTNSMRRAANSISPFIA